MAEEAEDDNEKTEEPTARRLDEARKEGNIAQSREINSLFLLGAFVLNIAIFAPFAVPQITALLKPLLEQPDRIPLDLAGIQHLFWHLFSSLLWIAILPALLALFVSVAAGYVQFGLIWSGAQLKPDWSRISPLAGMKRLFSTRSLAEFVKGLLKIICVGLACYYSILPSMSELQHSIMLAPSVLLSDSRSSAITMMLSALSVITAIAVMDFLYQRFQYLQKLRLSRQELKEEFKETEGNPLIKQRLRQLRQERARKRMMAAVPSADVIITNPSHYAIALKYDPAKMSAPELVAKGVDLMAAKIKEIATQHKIPIVENPPLARGIYASVEIGMEVPPEFYKAVAEIIAFVFRLKRRNR